MCTYARISLTRSPSRSLFRPDLFHSPCPLFSPFPPTRHPPRTDPHPLRVPHRSYVPFLSRFHSRLLSLVARTIPPSLSRPRFPSLAPSRSLRLRASALVARSRAFFFSLMPPFFFLSARPRGSSSDFYNLLLVAPHTTGLPPCVRRGPPGKTGK